MMYYRIAFQAEQAPTWTWKSTALTELATVFGFLRLYRALPPHRLRVFSSPAKEDLNEQLARENEEGASQSVTAAQFLQERKIHLFAGEMSARVAGAAGERPAMVSVAESRYRSFHEGNTSEPSLDERRTSALERRRGELERGPGGDHDMVYIFVLPTPLPQLRVWVRLLASVQHGDLQP